MTNPGGPRRPKFSWAENAVMFELATSDAPMSTAQLRAAVHPTTHPDPTDTELLVALRRLALRGRIVAQPALDHAESITYWAMAGASAARENYPDDRPIPLCPDS